MPVAHLPGTLHFLHELASNGVLEHVDRRRFPSIDTLIRHLQRHPWLLLPPEAPSCARESKHLRSMVRVYEAREATPAPDESGTYLYLHSPREWYLAVDRFADLQAVHQAPTKRNLVLVRKEDREYLYTLNRFYDISMLGVKP